MSGYSLPSDAMNTSKSLDSILRKMLGHDDPVEIGNGYHDDCAEEIAEAKQAIVEAVEGLIGEDEPVIPINLLSDEDLFIQIQENARNKLRAEQRKAIKEWQDYGGL